MRSDVSSGETDVSSGETSIKIVDWKIGLRVDIKSWYQNIKRYNRFGKCYNQIPIEINNEY